MINHWLILQPIQLSHAIGSAKGLALFGWQLNWFYVPVQLIYGYVDNDNDDRIDRNPDLHFKDKGSLTSHTT